MSNELAAIVAHIAEASGRPFAPSGSQSIGGGCINTTLKLDDGEQAWFVKLNDASRLDMFEAEAEGLGAMAATETIRVPRPLCHGIDGNRAYLVIEYIPLGHRSNDGGAMAGRQLAAMHRAVSDAFGWHRDNTIGSTHQPNDWMNDWVDFWRERRLRFQLDLAASNGCSSGMRRDGERLLDALPALIDHDPEPSLLHGDLWGGNMSFDAEGNPVIYDPAVYYGDREADIAMTELFGGFGRDFYSAYNEAWPLSEGYRVRRDLYNLYHVLNHFNMFGGGYLGQAHGLIDRLLAEVR